MKILFSICLGAAVFLMLTSPLPAALEAVTPAGQQYSDFTSQVILTLQALGGVTFLGKVSLLITLLISSMKSSALNDLIWKRLGAAQTWVAPVLGLVAGVTGLGAGGLPLTPALIAAYVTAGGGAVFVHEILDTVKAMPGVGPVYKTLISWVELRLGGPAAQAAAQAAKSSRPSIADTLK